MTTERQMVNGKCLFAIQVVRMFRVSAKSIRTILECAVFTMAHNVQFGAYTVCVCAVFFYSMAVDLLIATINLN